MRMKLRRKSNKFSLRSLPINWPAEFCIVFVNQADIGLRDRLEASWRADKGIPRVVDNLQ